MKAFMKTLAYGLACFNIASGYTDDYTVVEAMARDLADEQ